MALLEYWRDEPPAHVTLALRYLGESRRRRKPINAEQAREDLAQIGQFLGKGAQPMPDHLKNIVRDARRLIQRCRSPKHGR